jgi:D-glycero-alpha-D-manno-heptose-7-phosphate kinase
MRQDHKPLSHPLITSLKPPFVSRAPLRVSFVGGGSDLPEYFEAYGGMCIGAAITKYNRLSVADSSDADSCYQCIMESGVTRQDSNGAKIVQSAFETIKRGGSDRRCFRSHLDLTELGSGLGASGSLAVAAIMAAARLSEQCLSQGEVAQTAYFVERELCGFPVGKQDHYASAFGGFNVFTFHGNGDVDANPLRISTSRLQELEHWLLLVRSTRVSSGHEIARIHKNSLRACPSAISLQHAIKREVEPFASAIEVGAFDKAALILGRVWKLKRQIAVPISNQHIDNMYQIALSAGALGGKLMGAGAGGHLLLMAPPDLHPQIYKRFHLAPPMPVEFDMEGVK